MATRVRCYLPNSLHMVTRRVTQRTFLLKPDPLLNSIVLYCLGVALDRYPVKLHGFVFLSNHVHLLLTDVHGSTIPEFNRYFFSLLARAANRYRKRSENFWNSRKPNSVEIPPTAEDITRKLTYILCNPVLSGLVSRGRQWPGAKVEVSQLGAAWVVKRPKIFFKGDGTLPDKILVSTTLPQCCDMAQGQLLELIKQRCHETEAEKRREFSRDGRTFLGAKRILEESPFSRPDSDEEGSFEPFISSHHPMLRWAMILWLQERAANYQLALQQFRQGHKNVLFPMGTYKMDVVYGCNVESPRAPPWTELLPTPQ